jgi:hypothetical protein
MVVSSRGTSVAMTSEMTQWHVGHPVSGSKLVTTEPEHDKRLQSLGGHVVTGIGVVVVVVVVVEAAVVSVGVVSSGAGDVNSRLKGRFDENAFPLAIVESETQ